MSECDDCIELVDAEVCDGWWCRHRGYLTWSVVLVLTGGVGGAWSCGVWSWLGGGCWGYPSCVGGCLLPWGCGPVVCSRVWCAPSLGGACLDVCACGDDREYEGVPHRPGVRERRKPPPIRDGDGYADSLTDRWIISQRWERSTTTERE